eukprot:671155-Alexandrium_andersonii.AAC.1
MLALQERIQGGAPVDHPAMFWLVEHAGELLTKYLVGHDGHTAFEQLMGNPSRDDGYEFGERVFLPRPTAGHGPQPQPPLGVWDLVGAPYWKIPGRTRTYEGVLG